MLGHISQGDMTQFACHTVCTRPRRTVHPHCEPHPRTEIGRQNQLLRKAVFYYVPGELQVNVAGKLNRTIQRILEIIGEII